MTTERHRLPDASIRLDSMPTVGRDLNMVVDKVDRDILAAELAIVSLDRLEVKLHAVRFRGGFRVTGRLTGRVVQQSVISFEPVTQDVAEPIDRVFLPGGEKDFAGPADAEIFVDLDGEDMPDHFEGNEADLTDLIVEILALAIDPYPRAPGESVDQLGIDAKDEEFSPFAALKKLKDEPNES